MSAPKVLVVGPYREGSGYARAAADLALALHAAGADVACRPVCYGPAGEPADPRLVPLEARRFPAPDALLQVLPARDQALDRAGGRNVGLFFPESAPIPSAWVRRACLLDAALFAAREHAGWFRAAPGYDPARPALHCPLPADPARYLRSYPRVPRFEAFKAGGRFLFYTVGELVKRKNLSGLLRAFFAEFRGGEPVGLVVKTHLAGQGPAAAEAHAHAIVREVLRGAKLADPPPVWVVADRLSEAGLAALHLACDVFVQPSFAEGWSYPAFDALAFGKTPVVTATGGYLEYVDAAVGWLVPGRPEPVFGERDVCPELFTGRQTWVAPDLVALRRAMREAYEDRALRADKASRGLERASELSYEALGPRLLKALLHEGRAPGPLDPPA